MWPISGLKLLLLLFRNLPLGTQLPHCKEVQSWHERLHGGELSVPLSYQPNAATGVTLPDATWNGKTTQSRHWILRNYKSCCFKALFCGCLITYVNIHWHDALVTLLEENMRNIHGSVSLSEPSNIPEGKKKSTVSWIQYSLPVLWRRLFQPHTLLEKKRIQLYRKIVKQENSS